MLCLKIHESKDSWWAPTRGSSLARYNSSVPSLGKDALLYFQARTCFQCKNIHLLFFLQLLCTNNGNMLQTQTEVNPEMDMQFNCHPWAVFLAEPLVSPRQQASLGNVYSRDKIQTRTARSITFSPSNWQEKWVNLYSFWKGKIRLIPSQSQNITHLVSYYARELHVAITQFSLWGEESIWQNVQIHQVLM